MKRRGPRVDEQAAADAISAVVELLEPPEFEPNGRDTAPDWRMWMHDGCTADVEVTSCTDGEAAGFFKALYHGGLERVWCDKRLSHRWRVWVADHSDRGSERRSVKELVGAVRDTLVFVEARCGTPEHMAAEAQRILVDPQAFFNSPSGRRAVMLVIRSGMSLEEWLASGAPGSGYWYPPLLLDYNNGDWPSQHVRVVGLPEPLGVGKGRVETAGTAAESGAGHGSPAPVIQQAIVLKTDKQQLDNAPDRKWLAVVLDGIPGFQLTQQFGPDSRVRHPTLERHLVQLLR